jgi:hypothetical protein
MSDSENQRLNEKSQTQKCIYCRIPLISNKKAGKINKKTAFVSERLEKDAVS